LSIIETPLKRCEFWKLVPPNDPCFYYAQRCISVSGPAPYVDFEENSFIDFEGWICEQCEDYLEEELTKQFGKDWYMGDIDTIANYLLRTCSRSKD